MSHSREHDCTPPPWLPPRVAPPCSHFHPTNRSLLKASHHYHSGHLTLLVLGLAVHQVPLSGWCVVDRNPFINLSRGGIREELFCLKLECGIFTWMVQLRMLEQSIVKV